MTVKDILPAVVGSMWLDGANEVGWLDGRFRADFVLSFPLAHDFSLVEVASCGILET